MVTDDLTFEEFKADYAKWLPGYVNLYGHREGQVLIYKLMQHRPWLSEQLRAAVDDPFYRDAVLDETWVWLEKHWNDDKEAIDGYTE